VLKKDGPEKENDRQSLSKRRTSMSGGGRKNQSMCALVRERESREVSERLPTYSGREGGGPWWGSWGWEEAGGVHVGWGYPITYGPGPERPHFGPSMRGTKKGNGM